MEQALTVMSWVWVPVVGVLIPVLLLRNGISAEGLPILRWIWWAAGVAADTAGRLAAVVGFVLLLVYSCASVVDSVGWLGLVGVAAGSLAAGVPFMLLVWRRYRQQQHERRRPE